MCRTAASCQIRLSGNSDPRSLSVRNSLYAVKIDAMLKSMKVSGNTTIVAEVQNEARRILEYEIDF